MEAFDDRHHPRGRDGKFRRAKPPALSAVSKRDVLAAAEDPGPTPPPGDDELLEDDDWVTPIPVGEDDWYEPEPDYEGIIESRQIDPEEGIARAENRYEQYIGMR